MNGEINREGLLKRAEEKGEKKYIILAVIFLYVLLMGIIFTEPFDWEGNKPIPYSGVFHSMASASAPAKEMTIFVGVMIISVCVLWYWFSKMKPVRKRFSAAIGVVLFILGCFFIFGFGISVSDNDVVLRLIREGRTVELAGSHFKFTEKFVPRLPWLTLVLGFILLGSAYLLRFRPKKS